jgi:hypothetical protein
MPVSSTFDEEYMTAVDTPTPWWRRDTRPRPAEGRIAEKQRSQHLMRLPGGEISIVLPPDVDEPSWLIPCLEALSDIGSLPENWNSYGASPVAINAVADTLRLMAAVMSETMPLPNFVPTRRGGIQLEWHTKGIDLEIDVLPSGRLYASLEDQETGEERQVDITANLQPLRPVLVRLEGA